jgi:hypothetical protein
MVGVPFCDTPGQSLLVDVAAGAVGGVTGVAAGLGVGGVVAPAAALVLVGELLGHLLRGDEQFGDAVRQARGSR